MKFKNIIAFLLLITFLLVFQTNSLSAEVASKCFVHFIDVGQADCVLVKSANATILIDAGNRDDSTSIIKYLKTQGVKSIDLAVGTHPHEDHIGGLADILKAVPVKKLMMPKVTTNTKTFEYLLTTIKKKGMKIASPNVGEKLTYGNMVFTVMAPNGSVYEDMNNYSIVLKLQNGTNSFLFTGDAEDISEAEMLSKSTVKASLKADVLKVGHHGSANSSTDEFLDVVKPKYAVIPVGKGNDYGHPAKSTIERLQSRNINVFRTDLNGTIVATSDGKNLTFNKKVVQSNNSTKTNLERVVYFTPKGKSYHYTRSCRTLSKSKTILQGTIQEAVQSGHGDPCDVCTK